MRENRLRSISKGASWRIIATLTTVILVFIFTGSVAISLRLGAIEVLAKIIFYYLHERVWNKIGWGKD